MARINNLSEGLQSYLQGMTEEQAIKTLQQEGRRLKYIALKVWRKYLSDYQPKQYVRTRDTQRGIKLGRVRKISPYVYGIDLKYENDLMYHDSVFGNNYPKGHSLMLISEGWKVKKGRHKDIYMFGYFEGADIIGQIEREYNKFKPKGITLETQWTGKFLK